MHTSTLISHAFSYSLIGIEDILADPNKPCWQCRKRFDALGRPTKYGWTDKTYLEKGLKYCVWKPIPVHHVEVHLINFVNFWFSGDMYSSTAVTVIRNVLLMMPVGTSKELLLKNVFDSAIETAQTPPIVHGCTSVIKKMHVDARKLEHMETINAVNFFKWLLKRFAMLKIAKKKGLEDQTYRQEYFRIIRELRLVLGFCALILIRLMIMNEHRIKQFVECDGTTTFKSLFPEVDLTAKLVPPIWDSLKVAARAFNDRRNELSKNLLQLVVFQYVKSSQNSDDASAVLAKRILEEGCLNAMQGNGMGLVTMFDDVKRMYTHVDNHCLLPFVADKNPELDGESVERLVKFMDVYYSTEKPQYSWKWARILSSDYFSDLNIRRNRTFCHKLALLLVGKNPRIFEHKDLKHDFPEQCYNSPLNENGKEWAQSTLTSLQERDDRTKLDYISTGVAECVKLPTIE